MSDLRVALVAEGPTDGVIIQAALKAILPRPFVLIQLQPEPKLPKLGAGWGGVLRWCLEFASRGYPRLEEDPTLLGFDLFILHVDADVAECAYTDVNAEMAHTARARGWEPLPKRTSCPPPEGGADAIRACLRSWLGIETLGRKTVLCVPSKASDAWLASAVFENEHELLKGIECNLHLAFQMERLKKGEKIKKSLREYRVYETKISDEWVCVRRRCSQAERFSVDVALSVCETGPATPNPSTP